MCRKNHALACGFGFGCVLSWGERLFGIHFRVCLELVEQLELVWGLTLNVFLQFASWWFRICFLHLYTCVCVLFMYVHVIYNMYVYKWFALRFIRRWIKVFFRVGLG